MLQNGEDVLRIFINYRNEKRKKHKCLSVADLICRGTGCCMTFAKVFLDDSAEHLSNCLLNARGAHPAQWHQRNEPMTPKNKKQQDTHRAITRQQA